MENKKVLYLFFLGIFVITVLLTYGVQTLLTNRYKKTVIDNEIELKYKSSLALTIDDIIENNTFTKKIIIKNNTEEKKYYSLVFERLENNIPNGDLKIKAKCVKGGCTDIEDVDINMSETQENIIIKNGLELDSNKKHVYEVTVTYYGKEELSYDNRFNALLNIIQTDENNKVIDSNSNTLVYDNNGGSGCSLKVIKVNESYGELCVPVRKGYSFDGWYTSSKLIEKVKSTTILNINEQRIIYASWKPNRYILTLSNEDGNGDSTKNIYYNDKYGILDVPKKDGYTFLGWYTNSGERVTSETVHTVLDDVTLYSKWDAKSDENYKIKYETNGGSKCEDKTIGYLNKYESLCTSKKNNNLFVGWYIDKEFNTQITKDDIFNYKNDVVLYAKWVETTGLVNKEDEKYKIIYSNNGGSGCVEKNVTYNTKYGSLCVPKRSGYVFDGWYNVENKKVNENTILTTKGDVLLEAKWKSNSYKLSYDNSECESRDVYYGEKYGELCKPNKKGYTFNGWYTSLEFTKQVKSTDIVNLQSNQTLYAKFSANNYIITLDLMGGSGCDSTVNIEYNKPYGSLCTPVTPTYSELKLGNLDKANFDSFPEDENHEPPQASIFIKNGYGPERFGILCPGGKCRYPDFCLTALADPKKKQVFTFVGWSTCKDKEECYNKTIKPEDLYTLNTNQTLYAMWYGTNGTNCLN